MGAVTDSVNSGPVMRSIGEQKPGQLVVLIRGSKAKEEEEEEEELRPENYS